MENILKNLTLRLSVLIFLIFMAIINTGCSLYADIWSSSQVDPTLPSPQKTIVKQLTLGEFSACVLLSDSRVKCWGQNWSGQLGLGDDIDRGALPKDMGDNLPALNLGSSAKPVFLTSGRYYTCALMDNGRVKCWGENYNGELGIGSSEGLIGDEPGEMGDNLPFVDLGTNRKVIQLAAGGFHTCALLDNYKVKCWGSGGAPLGLGDLENRGDDPGEMGDNLPYVNLGTGRTALQITSGDSQSCAILDNHKVKCWGYNSRGQLGQGDKTNLGSDLSEMGDNLPYVDLGSGRTATSLSVTTGEHICAILDDNSTKCWGYGMTGELGIEESSNRGDAPGEMGDDLPSVNLGTGHTALALVTGRCRTCAILDNHQLKCWGWNSTGVLGLGDLDDRGGDLGEMGDTLAPIDLGEGRTVTQVAIGWTHTCAILDNGKVKCWGENSGGLLGLGDTALRGSSLTDMGDNLPYVNIGYEITP